MLGIKYFLSLSVLTGRLLYSFFLPGLFLCKLILSPFELFPDGDTAGLGTLQQAFGVFRKASCHRVRLAAFEKQQVFVRPGFIKGIIHIEAAGHPVKLPGSFNFNAVCGGSVGHELAHRLPAVGRLVLPAGLCNFAARRLERLGQHPRRQLAGLYG
jgi:hypothetical protein